YLLFTGRSYEVKIEVEALPRARVAHDLANAFHLYLPGVGPLVDLDAEACRIDLGPALQLLDHRDDAGSLGRTSDAPLEALAQVRGHPVGAPDEVVEDGVGVAPRVEHRELRRESPDLAFVRLRISSVVKSDDLRDSIAADPDHLPRA